MKPLMQLQAIHDEKGMLWCSWIAMLCTQIVVDDNEFL
jgi:hypothetical protein